jgi:hypothetical protein
MHDTRDNPLSPSCSLVLSHIYGLHFVKVALVHVAQLGKKFTAVRYFVLILMETARNR